MAKQKQQEEDIYRQAMEVVDDDGRWTEKKNWVRPVRGTMRLST
jgi:hypothetical protein